MNKRTGNLSSAQKTELLEYLERNPALQKGKFSNDFTFKKAQGMWMEVSNTLNSLPGAHKDWRQWRKAWQDMEVAAKKKKQPNKKFQRGTGGGLPILPPLNENEEAIVQMIGIVATEGHPKILESDTVFENGVCQEVDVTTLHKFDHDYNALVVVNNLEDDENRTQPDQTPSISHNEKKVIQQYTKQKGKQEKIVRVERLNHTIAATEKLAMHSEINIKQTEEYQKKKLQLNEEDIQAKNRIAAALENIAV
ncbi:hypothetical protein JTB14_017550 [Gonioctena quinquepunctata]|nr:hypothetical protein JTB14_017550 [Gonioctena quinquepunctata]